MLLNSYNKKFHKLNEHLSSIIHGVLLNLIKGSYAKNNGTFTVIFTFIHIYIRIKMHTNKIYKFLIV